ncbi:similar to Saccharomyces cerevisiae YNL102W POL1 Catalytic subunit of the DNA polymerase I alpha-primase complex [Maudiozyma saulgeensis]|uniref:DNA polymerase n=1 Tax=Maudiozyma saulgeensis TaxID=1789683 RepID=A0A1X7QYT3_9SACH|nr:similar to Saccharomyces cerevisiae YNL102W POL1 Catalytic subunit of the DNA polymerase I alpha-primase complex [Kazachstania saulgeensis]
MSDKLAKLKKLQAARNGGSVEDDIDDTYDDDKLYDEVDEKEYRNRKRKELLQDDFVVDDDGVGYVDRGIEEHEEYFSDEYSDDANNKKSSKQKKKAKYQSKVKSTNQISNMLRAHSSKTTEPKIKKQIQIDEFDDILGEFDSGISSKLKPTMSSSSRPPSSPTNRIEKKRPLVTTSDLEVNTKKPRAASNSNTDFSNNNLMNSSPLKKSIKQDDDMDDLLEDVAVSPTMKKNSTDLLRKSNDPSIVNDIEDDEMSSDDDIVVRRRTVRSAAATRQINLNSRSNPGSSPFVTAPGTPLDIKSNLTKSASPIKSTPLQFSNKYTKEQVVDPETNSFKMYWLDYAEVNNTLVLFGKVKALDNTMISAMVQINGLERDLYFLPREGKTPNDIHEEIVPLLMEKYGLSNIRAKSQKMKYAFELPGIPHEADYLKVLLPFNTPKSSYDLIPPDLSSETFHHVFGGNTNILEQFLIQNKIMGPCWLEIRDGDFTALQNASHCSLEVAVSKPSNTKVLDDIKTTAGLNCCSLAIQTVMNSKENKQEIVSISISTYKNVTLDVPIPEDLKPDEVVTLVRPPQGSDFAVGLATLVKQKLPGNVRLFNNEKALLACFCAMMKTSDPDVLIGHRLDSIYLDVLVHRLFDLSVPTFSSLGRRSRKEWPDKFGRGHNNMNHFFIRDIVAGRLICDIGNEMGQSLTPKCQSWDLAEMFQVTCQQEHKALDINYQNAQYQNDPNIMTMALQENITNSMITATISFRIQMLSLTKQLTNLAGNAWSQTLGGTRAGRNEYILLHEFARNGYIVPDKETRKMKAHRLANTDDGENENNDTSTTSKKAKYQGGLVFEPEKGLHKNYILVMDFNSLYPSIIQEFNICFTTVKRNVNDIEELPDVPPSDMGQGVLPRLLATLVERRREVKKIMKTESDPHKRVQCDIRQQALKLTANSMYGCLGYIHSRFYAKPLAMLVTNKGREILMNTRQLAESMDLMVVYGDTDSVMIDTGCENYDDAIRIGVEFKKLVNERYRLLEIDIDNVFKKLLLHAKKKYAALNVTIGKDGKEHTVLEVKGLDMKRREYCPLSKDVSTHVLNSLLSDNDPESSLQEIYAYLENIRSKVESNEIRIDKYKINTRLSKDPKAYPNGKTMPAVQVAMRMRKAGRVVKAGTVITFVITTGKGAEDDVTDKNMTDSAHFASRAYALNDVMVKSNNLVPDPSYYLEKQIFAPVERLLERIESFDVVRLSEALGLDSKKFARRYADDKNSTGVHNLEPLETTISDIERFKDSAKFELNCPNCSHSFPFGGIIASRFYKMCYNGVQCKNCDHIFNMIQFTSQLESVIRSHISLYYASWLYCDDSTCGNVTRQISVFGKRCLNDGCTGVMKFKYTDKQLYNQLLYFNSLFDMEKNKMQLLKPLYYEGDDDYPSEQLAESSILALAEQNRKLFEVSQGVVDKYLDNCGRRYVDMGSIFDFMVN